MKKLFLIQIVSLSLSLLLFNFAWAKTPEKMSCKKTGNNTECVYKVTGQDITDPKAVSELYLNTNMPYALCASSKCNVNQKDPSMAQCPCPIYGLSSESDSWQSASVGPSAYDAEKPKLVGNKISELTSAYSSAALVDFNESNYATTCTSSSKTAWANCYGAKCRVTNNGTKALCDCPLVSTTTFVSVGPKNVAQCNLPQGQVWSSATVKQDANNTFIIRQYYRSIFNENYKMR
jgi:hypothetical protein